MQLKEKIHKHLAGIFLVSILTGVLVLHVGRLHYSLVHLPQYHGSWTESLKTLWHFDAWVSYFKSPAGLLFNMLGLMFGIIIPAIAIAITFFDRKKISKSSHKK